MAMVRVRKMRVRMCHPVMAMGMRMALAWSDGKIVLVPMMFVVNMLVLVLERLVRVLMLVALGQVQPDACAHQYAGHEQFRAHRLTE
jgi:hypothetical protein